MTDAQKTILVVDDEALVRDLYSVRLKRSGFAVREADNGEHGLADALSSKPDLIVLDMLMPGMNGYEMLKRLREDKEWGAQVPVIVLTNDDLDKADEFATIEATAPAYFLLKTATTPDDLVSKINDVFER